MTRQEFDALLKRRDEKQREHERACEILEEEGPQYAHHNYRRCVRLHDELAQLQQQIDDELAAEQGRDG